MNFTSNPNAYFLSRVFIVTSMFIGLQVRAEDSVNHWVGDWRNVDRKTQSITRVDIRSNEKGLTFHAWESCRPKDCDWGEQEVVVPTSGVRGIALVWEHHRGVSTHKYELLSDGRLKLHSSHRIPSKPDLPAREKVEYFFANLPDQGSEGPGRARHDFVPGKDMVLLQTERAVWKSYRDATGILLREIFRQGMLIAARDGLGLATRDIALREVFPVDPDHVNPPITMSLKARHGESIVVRLSREVSGQKEPDDWSYRVTQTEGHQVDYLQTVKQVEAFSRGLFVDALKKYGYIGEPNKMHAGESISSVTQERIDELTFSQQYAAVRDLHRSMHKQGESEPVLSGLVRAYSHLGVLTEYFMNATPKVFKARSLLYAERLLARHPNSASAFGHRAYARGLAGFHMGALADIERARELDKGEPGLSEAPDWMDILEYYCKHDSKKLIDLADKNNGSAALARFLAFLTIELDRQYSQTISAGYVSLRLTPECYRVIVGMCDTEGKGSVGHLTDLGSEMLANTFGERLQSMSNLPISLYGSSFDELGRRHDEDWIRDSGGIVRQLVGVDREFRRPSEPSWSLLGRMLEELVFVQMRWRAGYMLWTLEASLEELRDFHEIAKLRVPDHPYRAIFKAYTFDQKRDRDGVANAFRDTHFVDENYMIQSITYSMWFLKRHEPPAGRHA